jgi:hypothetical protein
MNSYLKIAIVIVAFVAGFFLGRKTIDVEEKVTFVKGETIHDTIVINEPAFVEIPSKPKYIYKYDTIVVDNIQYISEKVDTSAIIQDYILMRTYEFKVFNSDTLGKFDVKQQIGYNKLLSFDYTFTPMTKQITQYREPLFTPFVTAGYSTNQTVLLGGGFYYKNIGLEYNMNVSTNDRIWSWQVDNPIIFNRLNKNEVYHTLKLNYKF